MRRLERPFRKLSAVVVTSLAMAAVQFSPLAGTGHAAGNSPTVLASVSSAQGYQRPAQDKIAYLHDGSLLIGYFDGSQGVVAHVSNPTTTPVVTPVQTIAGDEVTLYTAPGAGTTDIWIQAGHELVGGSNLEQVQHGTYNGATFRWDAQTTIPGAIAPGRQDPSVTWTGRWLIATWWDDVLGSDSDNVFMNWTADMTGQTGWLSTAIQMTTTNHNITQPNIRHSARLGATVLVYATHYRDLYRVLPDTKADPSLANWTAEATIDPGYDDSEAGFGGPQVAIDENSGKIHVFRAVLNSGGPTWHGVTYWLGNPDAIPMVTGKITWNPRLLIDAASSPAPADIAGAVDASGKVFVIWTTSATAGVIKYATIVSPYTSASAAITLPSLGSQPRYPHVPAQAPLNRGYVPVVYQSGTGSPYSIVLDTTIAAAGGDSTPPTAPTGVSAQATPGTPAVNLAWNASTDNVGVAGYTIYRGGSVLGTVAGSTLAYSDTTVASLTAYSYTVDAFDAAGNHSAQSGAASLTTPDWTPPSVPAGLAATAKSPTEIDLGWSASTDNVGVAGYTIYRNGSVVASTSAGTTTWADLTVSPSTSYSYTVDAFDAAGNHSAPSAPISATTPAVPDTQAPTVPAGVAAHAGPVGEVDVSWQASTDNVGVTGYTVYRNGIMLATSAASNLAYADKSAAGSTSYSYTVDAFDAAGNHSLQSGAASVTTPDWTPPTAPSGLVANVVSNGEVDLSWNAAADNVGVTGYTVYRNGTAIGTTTGSTLSYADTGVGHGFTYSYTVDAFDAAGNHSAMSTAASATTLDDIAPAPPGNLTVSATSPTTVAVGWSAATDNVGVTGYDVFRDGVPLASVSAGVLTYTDSVAAGSTHSYTADAFDGAGNHSSTPAPISVTTSTADTVPPSVPAGLAAGLAGPSQVALSWQPSTDNVAVAGYTIYRNGSALATVGASTLAYTDAAVVTATTYGYTVDAFDGAGNHSAQSAPASVHVPGVPRFVQAQVATTGGRVTSMTVALGPVARGDLLVGWFGQYDSAGVVGVSDSVNGAWTRSVSTTWRGSTTAPGDIALYYFANSAAAPNGLTITITSSTATYLQAAAAEYSGVAAVSPLDQASVSKGSSTTGDSGLTAAVQAGELVFGGLVATNGPGTITPGTSVGMTFVARAQSSSGTQAEEDIVSGGAGRQHATFGFASSVPWFVVCAVFKGA